MRGLANRIAVVTGAGQGIGRAEAERLAAEGARVALWDRNGEEVRAAAEAIIAAGGIAQAFTVDVTQRAEVDDALAQVVSRWGAPTLLINNAGIIRDNLFFRMTEDDWDAVMGTHLKGTFLVTQAVQAHMVAERFGRIVNTSSTSALGNRGQANYSAAKAGLQGLTRTLAIELGPFNITVNAVAPGFIDTAMTEATARRMGLDPAVLKAAAAGQIPVGRVGTPEDVAGVAAFLLSDDAAFISGQVLYVRGGP